MTRQIDTGPLGLTAIHEYSGKGFRPEKLFPDFDPTIFDEAPETGAGDFYLADEGRLTTSIHSWLFRHAGKLVLIDTCMGQGKDEQGDDAPFLRALQAAGVTPEDIDLVVLTHLHTDHMKWTTRQRDGAWVPTFAKARYVAGAREYDHWQPGGAGLTLHAGQADILAECVAPLMEAGVLDLVADDAEILPGLRFRPVPGHTATQLAVELEAGDLTLIFAADALHHPVQIHRPQWGTFLCEDNETAEATRRGLLADVADRGAVLLPSHFGGAHAGLVHREGAGFAFEPVRFATTGQGA